MISVTFKGLARLQKDMRAETRRARYALNLAVRVEGFRLMRLLKKEIREGRPGGRRLPDLSVIARKRLHRGRNEPLRRLAVAVRYHIRQRDPVEMYIGWVGPRVSRRWKFLAQRLQEGFTTTVTDDMRKYLARYGGRLRDQRARKYFFLRADTTELKTPARPILQPFWDKHERAVRRNIRRNFVRKMAGKRI